MNPFEDLIRELGRQMGITLTADQHQSCLLNFPNDNIFIQIDLDTNADRILMGSELGALQPGSYREQIFTKALRMNATGHPKKGILAYSEKKDMLILFQFLPLAELNGEKLHHYLQLFQGHAKIWKEALAHGQIPDIEESVSPDKSGMLGLK